MEIQSDFSFWWSVLAIVIGGIISLWYYNIKSAKKNFLLSLRVLSILLVAFLLPNPFTITKVEEDVLPKIVVLHDVSISADSLVQPLVKGLKSKTANLEGKEILFKSFAGGIDGSKRNETDIASALNSVMRADKSRLESVVLISDGINNKGVNPIFHKERYTVPIHTIAVGDSTEKRDVKIELLQYPREASAGAVVPVDMVIKGPKNLKEINATLEFNGQTQRKKIALTAGIGRWNVMQSFDPKDQEYLQGKLSLEYLPRELNVLNNSQLIYIKNKKSEYEIHLVYDAPHPDIGVWQRAISQLKNTAVKLVPLKEYVYQGKKNTLAIQFAYKASTSLLKQFDIHVVGNSKIRSNAFNDLPIEFNSANTSSNVTPRFESFENLFSLPNLNQLQTPEYKAVTMPFGVLTIEAESQNIISQTTDGLENSFPLLAAYKLKDKNKAVYFGEGLWQYATSYHLLSTDSKDVSFEHLLNNLMMYLLKSSGRERLEIYEPKNITANELQLWSANVLNQNNEKLSGAELGLKILDSENKLAAEYTFSESNNTYQSKVAGLSAGLYTFNFTATFNNKTLSTSKKVLVDDVAFELQNKQADFALLRALSSQTKGSFYVADQLDEVFQDTITGANQSRTVVYKNEKKYFSEYWAVWLIIIGLLTTEWLIRRRNGLI